MAIPSPSKYKRACGEYLIVQASDFFFSRFSFAQGNLYKFFSVVSSLEFQDLLELNPQEQDTHVLPGVIELLIYLTEGCT